MVAAKLALLTQGQRQSGQLAGVPTQNDAAALLNVGERSVRRQPKCAIKESRSLGQQSSAARCPSRQQPILRLYRCNSRPRWSPKANARYWRPQRPSAPRRPRSAARRVQRIAEISRSKAALPGIRRYPVIYADPPWHFQVYDDDFGVERAAVNHYPTMPLQEISSLPVSDLTTPDAALFLWTTGPHLPVALGVIERWGFAYKANIVWVKDKIGLRYPVRSQHELLLVATRETFLPPCPQRGRLQ